MAQQTWILGSDPACDIVISEGIVSGRHCRLELRDSVYTLEDLNSTNGTYVNGQPITQPTQVTTADRITLGQSIPLPWPGTTAHQQPPSEDRPTPSAATPQRVLTIGRTQDNDIVLETSNVSSHHARLTNSGDGWVLEDVGSTNGTYVGSLSNKIQRARIKPTDRVYFGTSCFRVSELLAASQKTQSSAAAPAPQQAGFSQPQWAGIIGGVAAILLIPIFIGGYLLTREAKEDPAESLAQSAPLVPDTRTPKDEASQAGSEVTLPPKPPEDTASDLTAQERLARSLFLVICRDSQQQTPYRIGTAFAVDDQHVATSGSVIDSLQRLESIGLTEVVLYSPATQTEIEIVGTQLHPKYEQLRKETRQAQETYDARVDEIDLNPPKTDSELAEIQQELLPLRERALELMQRQAAYDVGIIQVNQTLSHWIMPPDSASVVRPNQKLNVVGYAYDALDPYFDPAEKITVSEMPARIKQLPRFGAEDPLWLVGQGSEGQLENVFNGGPAMNNDGKVIAVYSRPIPLVDQETNEPVSDLFDAPLFQRVEECLHVSP